MLTQLALSSASSSRVARFLVISLVFPCYFCPHFSLKQHAQMHSNSRLQQRFLCCSTRTGRTSEDRAALEAVLASAEVQSAVHRRRLKRAQDLAHRAPKDHLQLVYARES